MSSENFLFSIMIMNYYVTVDCTRVTVGRFQSSFQSEYEHCIAIIMARILSFTLTLLLISSTLGLYIDVEINTDFDYCR